jgi:alpha-L-fucosidase
VGKTNHAEWIRTTAQIPVGTYGGLRERFNPTKFDAKQWARMAKDAGMRYMVITTKHHDGFGLFKSAHTDFDIDSTPFKRDVMAELSQAVRAEGLTMGWYHSIMDWHHPDYLPRRDWEAKDRPADGADMDRYFEYLKSQVAELLTKYGPIGVMWFDGEWENTWSPDYGSRLYAHCRTLQPGVIVNNRVTNARAGSMEAYGEEVGGVGDFTTPEQFVPATGMPGVDWESCITINDHWGYNRADKNSKSSEALIRILVDVVSKGGNLLLNVGPKPDGTFPEESVERLKAIGRWMKVNGEAIHGTTASPFAALPWGRCTVREEGARSRLFLHVFDWPADGRLVVPGLGNSVRGVRLLADTKAKLKVERASTDDPNLIVLLPAKAPDAVCSVVELTVDGAPIVYDTPSIEAEADRFVTSIEFTARAKSKEIELRYTLDGSDPTAESAVFVSPVRLTESTAVKVQGFHKGRPVTAVASRQFEKVVAWPGQEPRGLKDGLKMDVYAGDFDKLPEFGALKPEKSLSGQAVGLAGEPAREFVARVFTGFVQVDEDDLYRFRLTSDDGSRLWIGGQLIVDHDGLHGSTAKTGDVPLGKGWHHIRVEWFNKSGGADLSLAWARPGQPFAAIASEKLKSK